MRSRSPRPRSRWSGLPTWTAGRDLGSAVKLATLKRGGRDGRLIIVSRDLQHCLPVPGIAPTLQAALDDWDSVAPRLRERAAALEASHAHADVLPFDASQCAAPLPRAYHWVD